MRVLEVTKSWIHVDLLDSGSRGPRLATAATF